MAIFIGIVIPKKHKVEITTSAKCQVRACKCVKANKWGIAYIQHNILMENSRTGANEDSRLKCNI